MINYKHIKTNGPWKQFAIKTLRDQNLLVCIKNEEITPFFTSEIEVCFNIVDLKKLFLIRKSDKLYKIIKNRRRNFNHLFYHRIDTSYIELSDLLIVLNSNKIAIPAKVKSWLLDEVIPNLDKLKEN